VIELDTEKFVFSNPGTLLLSIHQYYAGGISECRNPALQQMFMLIGRAEKAGSGVDKIMSGWQESHWRRPFLEIENQPDRVKLTLPMFSVIPDAVLDELNFVFNDVSHLTADELTALSFCQIEGSISNQRLQYVLNMHSSDITGLLKKLVAEKYLESDNNGRWTIYKISQKVASSKKVATSREIIDNQVYSNKKVATSDQKVDTSSPKVDTSIKKVATSDLKLETVQRKNTKRIELEMLILKICKEQYVKKEEIAKLLGKSEDYIRNRILPDLLKSGKLVKRYPYTHNHPEQGYKTSEEYAADL
jgi:predicted HTH transcriptional regulator